VKYFNGVSLEEFHQEGAIFGPFFAEIFFN